MPHEGTTPQTNPTAELNRVGKNIRKHSQELSRDLAQMRDLLAQLGIKLTITPTGEYDQTKDQTR